MKTALTAIMLFSTLALGGCATTAADGEQAKAEQQEAQYTPPTEEPYTGSRLRRRATN